MRRRASVSIVGALILAATVSGAVVASPGSFAGRWVSTDPGDGSSQVLLVSDGPNPSVVFQDFYARSCDNNGSRSTHWVSAGGGEIDGDTMYVGFHKSGCGSFTIGGYDDYFVYDAGTDTLTDSFGIVWQRSP